SNLQKASADAFGLSDIRVAVLSSDGEAYSAQDSPLPPLSQDELQVAQGQGTDSSIRTAGARNGSSHFRVIAVPTRFCPVRQSDECSADPDTYLQPGALVVAQSLGPIDQTLHNLGIVLWAFGLIGVIGAALAGNAVAR